MKRHLPSVAAYLPLLLLTAGAAVLDSVGSSPAGSNENSNAEQKSVQEIQSLIQEGRYAEAETLARGLLARTEQLYGPESIEAARVLNPLVEALRRGGKAHQKETLELSLRAVSINERVHGREHLSVADSLDNLGNLLLDRGQFREARTHFERGLAIRQRLLGPDDPAIARSLHNLANVLADAGVYADADALYRRELTIIEKARGPDDIEVAGVLYSLGRLVRKTGDYEQARSLYERALAIAVKARGPEHPQIAWIQNGLGMLMEETGEYTRARESYEEALAVAGKALGPDHPFVASCLNNLGLLSRKLGDYTSARSYYVRALELNERTHGPDHPYTASSLKNLGDLLHITGAFTEARSLYERALVIRQKAFGSMHPEVGVSHQNLGSLLADLGEPGQARIHYDQALAIWAATLPPDHPDVADTLALYADLLLSTNDAQGAESKYGRALEIWESTFGSSHPRTAELLRDLATARMTLGQSSAALETALRAEQVARENLRLTVASLPERQALRYATVRARGLDVALSLLGTLPSGAEGPKVWDALIRSRALVLDEMATRRRSLGGGADPETRGLLHEWNVSSRRLANLTLIDAHSRSPEETRRLVQDEQSRKENIERRLSKKSMAFRRQQARQQAGLTAVREAVPRGSALVAYVLYEHEMPAANARPGAPAKVPSYLGFVLAPDGRTSVVPLGPAAPIHDEIAHWSDAVAHPPPPSGQASKVGDDLYRAAGEALRRRIWDRLAAEVEGADRVFVVPDGMIHLIDFAAMPIGDAKYLIETGPVIHYLSAERDIIDYKARSSRTGNLLVVGDPDFDDETPFAALRGQQPVTPQGRTPEPVSGSVFRSPTPACADFKAVRFERLPASEREAEMIAALWTRQNEKASDPRPVVDVLMRRSASEAISKQKAAGRRVLHLATHGFFLGGGCASGDVLTRGIGGIAPVGGTTLDFEIARENPLLLSGLALAGANRRSAASPDEDDGILTAEEIAAMDLTGVEWAVLSACNTAAGELSVGEGVLGLRRAFQVAGAATVIMSLWAVDDAVAQAWMAALYESHLVDRLGTAEAVRAASLRLLRERRQAGTSVHPFYWGGWVAAGDWR